MTRERDVKLLCASDESLSGLPFTPEVSGDFFHTFFENANMGFACLRLDDSCMRVNDALCRMLGYPRAELLRMRFVDLMPADDGQTWTDVHAALCMRQRKHRTVEVRLKRRDGALIWVQANASAVVSNNGQPECLIAVVQDITARKAAQARAEQQAAERAVQEDRGRLARDLHDSVTQTLFTATVVAQTLPKLWEHDPDAVPEQLERIQVLNQAALAEMRALLLDLRPAHVQGIDLVEQLPQLVAAAQGQKQLYIETHIENAFSPPAEVQIALYRIAQEALNNIVKHARAQHVSIAYIAQPNGYVELRVEDNGNGFDLSHSSSGMGLTIMRERAEEVGAEFQIISERNSGTCIVVAWRQG